MRITDCIREVTVVWWLSMVKAWGQVASQTYESMQAITAVTNTPVIRPVVTMTNWKSSILPKPLILFEISIQPFEDCCTIFAPDRPKTNPKLKMHSKEQRWTWKLGWACGSRHYRNRDHTKSRKRWGRWPDRGLAGRERLGSIQPLSTNLKETRWKNYRFNDKFVPLTGRVKVSFTGPKKKKRPASQPAVKRNLTFLSEPTSTKDQDNEVLEASGEILIMNIRTLGEAGKLFVFFPGYTFGNEEKPLVCSLSWNRTTTTIDRDGSFYPELNILEPLFKDAWRTMKWANRCKLKPNTAAVPDKNY